MISKNIKPNRTAKKNSGIEIADLVAGVLSADRRSLAQAITLVESRLSSDRNARLELMASICQSTNKAKCIAITGPPGAGKSSFIESMGMRAIRTGMTVAVLSIDPSSELTHGSILGDKTRMPELSVHPSAFVRPTPSSGDLGGISRRTLEVKQLCEAAGYNFIFIETVGVGQSESEVSHLVDMVTLLLQPGSGDELQGIKKGINELADFFVVNKADGNQIELAREAKSFILASTKLGRQSLSNEHVTLHSHHNEDMMDQCYMRLINRYEELVENGAIQNRRSSQLEYWFFKKSEWELLDWIMNHPAFQTKGQH